MESPMLYRNVMLLNPISVMKLELYKGGNVMNKMYDDINEYKKAVLSDCIKPWDIMKEITLPDCVYKYRKFDVQYLKKSLDGEMFFSSPADMNVNDSHDCQINFNKREVLKTMCPEHTSDEELEYSIHSNPEVIKTFNEWIEGFQSQLRVGCFTTCDCSHIEMWDNQYFGDEHKGYCIKYKVDPSYFYPNTIVFLKVLYDDKGFDATDAMKNFIEWLKAGQSYCDEKVEKMCCLGHNHTLFKSEKYKDEEEWRIIIPKNRFSDYFGRDEIFTKDFGSLMQGIYLGSEFKKADKSGEMYHYALEVCKRKQIPLYVMKESGNRLEEELEYNPEIA